MSRSPSIKRPFDSAARAASVHPGRDNRGIRELVQSGCDVAWLAAMLAALLLSPSSYADAPARRAFAVRGCLSVTSTMLSFVLLSSCMSGVLVRVVVVAAQDYGLLRFALDGIVRVLLLELIPLLAALFVLVEISLPAAAALSLRHAGRQAGRQSKVATDRLRRVALPHALAAFIAPSILSVLASWIALVLGYLELYGATPWALAGFSRVLGNVFEPVAAGLLVFKLIAFSAVAALLPIAAALALALPAERHGDAADFTLTTLIRVGALLLLIELLSLLAGYA